MKNGLSVDDDLRDCMILIQSRISSIGGQRQRSQIPKVGTKHSQSTEKFVILCHDLSVVGTCLPLLYFRTIGTFGIGRSEIIAKIGGGYYLLMVWEDSTKEKGLEPSIFG